MANPLYDALFDRSPLNWVNNEVCINERINDFVSFFKFSFVCYRFNLNI